MGIENLNEQIQKNKEKLQELEREKKNTPLMKIKKNEEKELEILYC